MKPALVEAASLAFPTRSIFLTIRGKPIAGNRHDGFEAAGAGNQFTVLLVRHSQRKRGATDRLNLRARRQSSTQPGSSKDQSGNPGGDDWHNEIPSEFFYESLQETGVHRI